MRTFRLRWPPRPLFWGAGLLWLGILAVAACGDDAAAPAPGGAAQPAAEEANERAEAEAAAPAEHAAADAEEADQAETATQAEVRQAAAQQQAQAAPPPAPVGNVLEGEVAEYVAGVDYFPDKATLTHAAGFSVRYIDHYKVVSVPEPFPGGEPETYVLVQRGTPSPSLSGELAAAQLIQVPIRSMFSGSTTHLPALQELGVLHVLTGVSSHGLVVSPAIRERIAVGAVVEYAPTFQIDAELVIAEAPEILMTSGFADPTHQVLSDAGVTLVANTEWLESSPLARAEWIKYVALFSNREAAAEAFFAKIVQRYEALQAAVKELGSRPSVQTGFVFGGIWYASGGDSYVARLLADAGAGYVWADNDQATAIQLDLEAQLDRAQDAEFWLDVSVFWTSLEDALSEDSRYAEFSAFQSGNVWNPTRIVGEGGGLDFYERGVTRPDLVLSDLIKIFHPELLPDHEMVWYERLPSAS